MRKCGICGYEFENVTMFRGADLCDECLVDFVSLIGKCQRRSKRNAVQEAKANEPEREPENVPAWKNAVTP